MFIYCYNFFHYYLNGDEEEEYPVMSQQRGRVSAESPSSVWTGEKSL